MGGPSRNAVLAERALEKTEAAPIVRAMRGLRRAAWRRLMVERGAGFLAAMVGVVLAAVVVDYLFRLPVGLRVLAWGVGVVAGGAGFARVIWPVWRFRPDLVEVALRVEHSEEAARAGLRGRLASAVELASAPPPGSSPEMVGSAVRETLERFGRINASGATILTSSRAQRGLAGLVVALLPVLAGFWAVPDHARIGVQRVLLPWMDVAWPKRTTVMGVTKAVAHPLDAPLTLRALLTRSSRGLGRADVSVVYRVLVDGKPGPQTRLLLNPLKQAGGELADVYESALSRDALRLAAGLTPEASAGDGVSRVLEFSFRAGDDETPVEKIILVDRPRVVQVSAKVLPPEYAAGSPVVASGVREVAMDASRHGILGPVLAGSKVELTLSLSKAVPTPGVEGAPRPLERAAPTREAWVAVVFGPQGVPAGAAFDLRADAWTVVWTAETAGAVAVRPVDAYDIAAAEEAVVTVSVSPDTAPGATVVDPAQDESVLASAVLPVAGEGRDDVALRSVALEAQRLTPPAGSAGAPPEPAGDARVLASVKDPPVPSAAAGQVARPVARVSAELDLGSMTLAPGDEVWVTAVAADGYSLAGAVHEPVRSAPRRLRIISEAQLAEQILDELGALKTVAQRIDADQAAIADRSRKAASPGEDRAKAPEAARDQKAVAERLRPAQELLGRAQSRAERNGLSDEALKSLLRDAAGLVRDAAEASERAADAVERVGQTPAGEPAPAEAAQRMEKDQARVREDMGKLSDLLSRGRDGWAARQSVDRLLNEQRDLIEQTRRAGAETAGKTPQQLTPEQRAELDRMARAQEDLSRKARQAVEDLAERANRVKPTDPAQAQAMERAAQQGMRDRLAEQMQQAADQQRQNQAGQAQQNQEQAAETLQQMLDQLDKAQQRRDEALQRLMANLMASIDGLIRQQEKELTALQKATGDGVFKGLAEGMVRLHGNTLGLAESTEAREAAEVVARLEAAAGHQDAAATNLAGDVDAATADESERMSLTRLREAREIAKAAEEEAAKRDSTRKLAELRGEYTKLADEQEKLRQDTLPLVGKELSRRDRNTAKTLGARQAELQGRLRELKDKTEGLSSSTMFEYAHRRLDAAAGGAAAALNEGTAPAKVGRQQAEAVEVLRMLVSSLKGSEPPKNEFRQQQGGQGGQQGGQGGQQQGQQKGPVPPIAELLVLKQMQEEAARRTRETAGAPDAEEVRAIGDLQQQLAELGAKVVEMIQQANGGGPGPEQKKPGEAGGGGR